MILVKKFYFVQFLFWSKKILKFCLGILSTEKNPLKPIKIATSENRIFCIFSEGVNQGFGSKRFIFFIFCWAKNGLEILFRDLFDRQDRFKPTKITTSHSHIFPYFPKGLTMILVQIINKFSVIGQKGS